MNTFSALLSWVPSLVLAAAALLFWPAAVHAEPSSAAAAISATAAPPVITSPTYALLGDNPPYFSYQIEATNHPTSFAASPVPDGFTFDPKTGILSGYTDQPGLYRLTISATNAAGTGSTTLTLRYYGVPKVSFVPLDHGGNKTEVQAGGAPVKINLVRSGGNMADSLYVYYVALGNAKPGEDYRTLNGRVIFRPGQATAKIKVHAYKEGTGIINLLLTPLPVVVYDPVSLYHAKIKIVPSDD